MKMTEKDLEVISHIMLGEQMAAKKARMYSKTLTDVALAEKMGALASEHQERFNSLLTVLSGGNV